MKKVLALLAAVAVMVAWSARPAVAADKINVLLIDGQNNHNYKATTPVIKDILEKSGRFTVDVLTSPPQVRPPKNASADQVAKLRADAQAGWEKFRPDFSKYQVVFSNYNGESWPAEVNAGLEKFMEDGGGLYIFHAANNAFTSWENWTKMVGLLWAGNNFGDRITVDDAGKVVRTPKGQGQGPGAGHGPQWPYTIRLRDSEHPVTKGMPATWTHAADELYQGQRGPALNMHILATAYAPKAKGGNDTNEPMVYTVSYGKGRVFVNLLGHDAKQTAHPGCAAFIARGTEWAATGQVTLPVPQALLDLGKAAGATPSDEPMGCDSAPNGAAGTPGATPAPAANAATVTPIQGETFDAWRKPWGEWTMASEAYVSPKIEKLLAFTPGTGIMFNSTKGVTCDLLTAKEFGDVEVHVEFMIPKGSNSGVYFMGRYELQIYDSFGKDPKTFSCADCGSIYQRWDPKRGPGKEGFEGHVPTINASLEPGKWQTFDVTFQAPRFDAAGKKIANAKFVKVVFNGQTIHQNVEVTGPTRSNRFNDEKATGPLMVQGDHGPVAYRNITIKAM